MKKNILNIILILFLVSNYANANNGGWDEWDDNVDDVGTPPIANPINDYLIPGVVLALFYGSTKLKKSKAIN